MESAIGDKSDLEADGQYPRVVFQSLKEHDSKPSGALSLKSTAISRETTIPIEFRTLSIQISESGAVEQRDDSHYFEKLNFHQLTTDQVCQQLNVSLSEGLASTAALRRLQRNGKNTLSSPPNMYIQKLLGYIFGGFCSVLWIGVIIFFLCWRPLSNPPSTTNLALAILVLLVIFLQASFSAFQDWSTRRVMNSILNMVPSECIVLRDSNFTKLPSSDLVVGDIVYLNIGNKVPADLRLLQSSGDIRFDRSILTGESNDIEGAIDTTDDNFLETRNIALMGTHVTNGNGLGVVVLTGKNTVMGRISKLTSGTKVKPTLIQQEITRFIRIIVCLTVLLASLILFVWAGWLRVDHHAFLNVVGMLNNVMGCVVAFIPEGMPVAVALSLSRIAHRMKKANILPKSLSTVETLGCVNVICSDKTGTLTQNKMLVVSVGFVDGESSIEEIYKSVKGGDPPATIGQLHHAAVLCNDASFDSATKDLPINERSINGDATDSAILRFIETAGAASDVRNANAKLFQIPFNSSNKWMLTMYENPDTLKKNDPDMPRQLVYIKGAPDILIPKCSTYWSAQKNEICNFDEHAKDTLVALQEKWSRNGQRVILLCMRWYSSFEVPGANAFGDEILNNCIQDLTIIGLLGIMDPPRPETLQTVSSCRHAGTRFFMVTGDFGLTAVAIARQIGILTGDGEPHVLADIESDIVRERDTADALEQTYHGLVLEGRDFIKLTGQHWDIICRYEEIVFARTTPEQKLSIVNEFKARHNVVAVTGDGVNDAPALKAADVGIAVVSGSDVAIEAADLVLLDKFDSITEAIRLGRLVFQNLQKVISYLLPAGSWSEIWPVILNCFFGTPLPLSSFLMIIICCFTDLFPCLALIMEKEEFDLLSLPPRNHRKEHLINLKIYIQSYLFIGVMETVCAHSMFFFYMYRYAGIPFHEMVFAFEKFTDGFHGYSAEQLAKFVNHGQSVYFVTLVILQWGNILSIRNRRLSILEADPIRKKRRNLWLLLGAFFALSTAIFVTEVRAINDVFFTAPVPIEFWLLPFPLAFGILVMDEFRKLAVRNFPRSPIAKIAW